MNLFSLIPIVSYATWYTSDQCLTLSPLFFFPSIFCCWKLITVKAFVHLFPVSHVFRIHVPVGLHFDPDSQGLKYEDEKKFKKNIKIVAKQKNT